MLMGIAIEIPFAIGEAVLGLEAYLIRDWKILQIVAYLPISCKPLLVFWSYKGCRLGLGKDPLTKRVLTNGRNHSFFYN